MQSGKFPNKQRAFSMVEVLVAMVVLSVGLLGIAALYATTLRSSSSSIARMQAVNLASDIADRIRANPNAGIAYKGLAATAQGCFSAPCLPAQIAANDLLIWQTQIAQLLPGGSNNTVTFGTVTYKAGAAGPPDTYTITIQWSEPNSTSAQSYVVAIQI